MGEAAMALGKVSTACSDKVVAPIRWFAAIKVVAANKVVSTGTGVARKVVVIVIGF